MKFDTALVQGGHNPSANRNAIAVPIYQTTAYNFNDVQYAADLFDLKVGGDIYTRISNPTTQVLEERLAMIEGGVGALCVSSGQSASLIAVLNIAKAGDEIVASENLYGGTINLLGITLEKMGIKTRFVASQNLEDFEKEINEKTACIFAETLTNPSIAIADIEGLAKIAHSDNALKVAQYLQNHKFVKSVCYPGLEGDKYHELAKKYLPKGASSLLSFVIDGDRAVATKFLENVKLLIHATNIGDTRTIVTYPALTTHRQLTAEQLEECGISESFIRLSVGIEDVEDIIADIDQALEKAMNT